MRDPTLQRHDEAVRILLIAAQREAELEEFRRDRGEPRCGNIFAIFAHRSFVSSTLISHQSVIQSALSSQAFVDRRAQEICIAKGIANSVRHHRVFVTASIAYECPAGSEGTAQKVGHVGAAIEPLFAASGAHSFRESGNRIHNAHELAFDIGFHRTKFVDGPTNEDCEQIVVGEKAEDRTVFSHVPLKSFRRHAAPVGEIPAGQRGSLLVGGSAHSTREGRILAICPNGHKRVFCAAGTLTVIPAANAPNAITVPQTVLHQEIRAELDTSFDRGFYQHLIKLSTSRGISPSHVSHPNVPSDQRKIPEVREMCGEWRAIRCNHLLQKSPVGEPLWTVPMYEVSPAHITGNNASVEKKHPVSVPCQ